MAEGNPTEFLIENDEKFIGEFIKFMRDNISQYHITDEEVNKLSSRLYYGANNLVDGYFGVTINMNLAQYTAKDTFSFDFIEADDLTKESRLFDNKVKKFMNSINGDKLETAPSSPKKKGGKRRKKKTRRKKGGMKKRHNIGKKIFKYDPHNKEHPKNKFNIGDRVKMITQLTDDECLFFMYMIDNLTDEKCKELHKDIWEVTKVETDIFNEYTYNIKNKKNFELLARPEETLSKWIEGRTVSIGDRRKKTRKKRGGCWPNCFKKKSNSNSGEFAKTKPPKKEEEMSLIEQPNQEVRRRGLVRIPSMHTLSKGKERVKNWYSSGSTSPTMDPDTAAHHNLPRDHFDKVDEILKKASKKGLGGGRRKTRKKKNRKRRTKKKTRRRKKR